MLRPGLSSGPPPGLIVSAASSGSGKTVLTLGLVRALRRQGLIVRTAKTGPDYIDPAFHAAASGHPCLSLDTWGMRPDTLLTSLRWLDGDMTVAEGVMGLFDGAFVDDRLADGSTAALALRTGLPVLFVLDVSGQSASAAAVAKGFQTFRPGVTLSGLILNRVGGPRHEAAIRQALAEAVPDVPVLGSVPRAKALDLPHRHLGLIQAQEHDDLDAFLDAAADTVTAHVDLQAVMALARPPRPPSPAQHRPFPPPPGQRVALARDVAFAFAYPGLLRGWQAQGAEILPFSPLADEAPAPDADAIYLPGGYPELHAGSLAAAATFRAGMQAAATRGTTVIGECGGYMTLGEALTDAGGQTYPMLGLLPVETSFARRKLHLGYRQVVTLTDSGFGTSGTALRGHEFHYASIVREDDSAAERLFRACDATGTPLPAMGLRRGAVAGSFLHMIDLEDF